MSQPLVEVGAADVDKRACDDVQTYVAAKKIIITDDAEDVGQ